jgi:AcrR family transcriptional regulator
MIRERGLDKVSWRAIARAVDYSPAGLYEYFDNKGHIVATLAEEGMVRLDGALAAVEPGLPVAERLLEMGRAYIAYAHAHPGHFHLVFSVLPSGRRSLEQPSAGAYRRLQDAMQQGLDEGLLHGDSLDADAMAYGFWGLVHGLASLQLSTLREFEADFGAADRTILAAFLRGLSR